MPGGFATACQTAAGPPCVSCQPNAPGMFCPFTLGRKPPCAPKVMCVCTQNAPNWVVNPATKKKKKILPPPPLLPYATGHVLTSLAKGVLRSCCAFVRNLGITTQGCHTGPDISGACCLHLGLGGCTVALYVGNACRLGDCRGFIPLRHQSATELAVGDAACCLVPRDWYNGTRNHIDFAFVHFNAVGRSLTWGSPLQISPWALH